MIAEMMASQLPPILMAACLLLTFNTSMIQEEECMMRRVSGSMLVSCVHLTNATFFLCQDLDWVELFSGRAEISKHFDKALEQQLFIYLGT